MSWGASQVTLVVKKPPANTGKETQIWSLGREDPLEEGLATTLQYSCLENPKDRGSWQATVQSHKELDASEAFGPATYWVQVHGLH